jgi:hypothetical protein
MLTNEEKNNYIVNVCKQMTRGNLLHTRVIVCSDNCKKLKMNFKMSMKHDIINATVITK